MTTFNLERYGQVKLSARPLAAPVEVFTISAREQNGRGVPALQWDRTELVAEFSVPR